MVNQSINFKKLNLSLGSGKHIIKEIEGIRCTVLDAGISENRMNFLKKLMEHNGYTVKVDKEAKKEEALTDTYIIGVTDIVFNPVIAVYQRMLRDFDNRIVTPSYWNQHADKSKGWYWKEKISPDSIPDL